MFLIQKTISKRYNLERISQAIRETRQTKGWSQRELSARSRIAQPQISRFENGDVDLQLSSLIELARALDLDLQLVPRSALPAVAAVVKEREERAEESELHHRLKRLIPEVSVLEQTRPHLTNVTRLKDAALEIETISSRLNPVVAAKAIGGVARRLEELASSTTRSPARFSRELKIAHEELRNIRNMAVHGDALRQIPAYSLDGED